MLDSVLLTLLAARQQVLSHSKRVNTVSVPYYTDRLYRFVFKATSTSK